MAGPWERYGQPATQPQPQRQDGPWARYRQAPDFSNVQAGPIQTQQETPRMADGWQPGVARSTMLGARDVIEGAGGLLGMVGGDAFNQYLVDPARRAFYKPNLSSLVTGDDGFQPTPSYRESASNIADKLGLPSPQTPGERVLSDIGQGLTGTALTMGAGSVASGGGQIAQRVGNLLTAQPGLQAVSTATGAGAAGATRESGGSEGQQLAAGLLGGLGPAVASAGTAAATRGLVRGRSGEKMQRTIEDFNRLGAQPSAGQASGLWGAQGAENLLAGGPTSSGVMTRFAERQADDIGTGLQGMADDLSRNASAERAGRAVERGVDLFSRNTAATKNALYWQADRFIPENTPVPLSNTWQTLDALTTPSQGAVATTGALINPRIAQLRQTLADDLSAGGGQIPYESLKRIRTSIREAIDDSSPLLPDTGTRQLRRLYGALSRDMEAAAQARGPEALRAARRANNYTRAVADRMEQVQRVIDKSGGPEKVFNAAMAGTRDGGTTLRAVMQSLPRDGQQAVTAAVIKRMGLANPGAQDAAGDVFSAHTFMTNWNKVSPEAKRALFDRHGPNFSRDMDRIARVAQNIKEGSKVYANPSGTANRGAAIGYWVSLLGALATGNVKTAGGLAAAGGAANATARLMTQPWAVRWLANSTALPIGSAVSQAQELGRLAERHEDPEIAELARVLEEQARYQQANAQGAQ